MSDRTKEAIEAHERRSRGEPEPKAKKAPKPKESEEVTSGPEGES
jgi:hypothetical protein